MLASLSNAEVMILSLQFVDHCSQLHVDNIVDDDGTTYDDRDDIYELIDSLSLRSRSNQSQG